MCLLKVDRLRVAFENEAGKDVEVVNDVDLYLNSGKTLGLVGESGSGKSVTGLALLRLLPLPSGKILGGSIVWKGRDLNSLSGEEIRAIRGREIGMIFQEPMNALNPVHTIGRQIDEVFLTHFQLDASVARARTLQALKEVGIPEPEIRAKEYPHQLSGGMRQRVIIAMALACEPALVIADEPTTALDVTIQAQILRLISDLQVKTGASMLLITHDLGVVAQTCDEVAVMYAGRIVERAPMPDIFETPRHAYTRALLSSIPLLDGTARTKLPAIPGTVPLSENLRQGCRFAPRSGLSHDEEWLNRRAPMIEVNKDHWVESCPACLSSSGKK